MRIKAGTMTRKRHKKILKKAKGYRDKRSNVYSHARRAVLKAGQNAYVGRKIKKRDYRALWISRLTAALKPLGVSYSRFIYAATRKQMLVNRKMLSELAINEPKTFAEIVAFVQK